MNHFTSDDYKPSELTLHIIRTLARSMPSLTLNEEMRKLHFS